MKLIKFLETKKSILLSITIFIFMSSFFLNNLPMSESTNFWELVVNSFDNVLRNDWHPPIYLFLLYISKLIFNSYLGGYFIGIMSVIITLILIHRIIIFNGFLIKDVKIIVLLYLGYFSMPIVLNGSFIFDIDNTILTPVILLVYLSYLRYLNEQNIKNYVLFIVSIVFSLWCKMSTPIFLLISIVLFHLISNDFKILIKKLLPIMLLGLLIFYLSYGILYTSIFLEKFGSFELSYERALYIISGIYTFQLSLNEFIFSVGSNISALILWSSPLFIIIVPYLILNLKKELTRREKSYENYYVVPLIFIIITTLMYTLVIKLQASGGFPKYHYPIFSFIFIIIGLKIRNYKFDLKKYELIYLVLSLLVFMFMIKDYLLRTYELGYNKDIFEFIIYFVKINTILIVSLLIYLALEKFFKKGSNNFLITSLLFFIVFNISSFIYRANADYSTNYHYGVSGSRDALNYANQIELDKSIYFPFLGLFIKKNNDNYNFANGRLYGSHRFIVNTDYLIITDRLLYTDNFFFKSHYVEDNYKRIKTIKSYGVWEKN